MEGIVAQQCNRKTRERFRGKRVHLVGIGGCGMQGAAVVLHHGGAVLSGSDLGVPEDLAGLRAKGISTFVGHGASHVTRGIDLVVYSAAIPVDNPELVQARELGIRTMSYAELLAALMVGRCGVAITGTHGKSTTTGLTTYLFREARLEPSFVIGADSTQLGGRSGVGNGEHFIVEACEYQRSFLHLRPHSAAVLNIEADHLDYYRDLDDVIDAFAAFCANVDQDGLIVIPSDDDLARRATADAGAEVETFGLAEGATWRAANLKASQGCYAFDVLVNGECLLHTELALAGMHNVSNALAATALARHAGGDPDSLARALRSFDGVRRRMMLRGQGQGVTVVDDYAHHPTEIRATLRAVRARYTPDRLWAVFQPHQYSRTRKLMDEFAQSFGDADMVLIPDIYAARDSAEDRKAIAAGDLVERIRSCGGRAEHIAGLSEVTEHLARNVIPGDLVLTMGAGDIWKVADGLVERIRRTG